MHTVMREELTKVRDRELRDGAAERRLAGAADALRHCGDRIVIRRSGPGDGQAIRDLAALDEQEWDGGPALLAEVEGSLRAAAPLDGSQLFADPFCETADIAALLELRAA